MIITFERNQTDQYQYNNIVPGFTPSFVWGDVGGRSGSVVFFDGGDLGERDGSKITATSLYIWTINVDLIICEQMLQPQVLDLY